MTPGIEIPFTRDLDVFIARLIELAPQDDIELRRLRDAARKFVAMKPPVDATELLGPRDWLRTAWEMRDAMAAIVQFRKPIGAWAKEHLSSERLRRLFTCMLPESTPTLFLLMVLGYLEHGYLSRPVGGTKAVRRALEGTYRGLGGEAIVNATVDEVLVDANHARGVRLTDGTVLSGDVVLSTASAPETVLRLLGGRYDADKTRERLDHWKLFDPIVLVSFGVAQPYTDIPSTLVVDGIAPFDVGGRPNDHLYLRIYNDDASFAPAGHTVVQAMLTTDYEWWATLGTHYNSEKDAIADITLEKLAPYFPDIRLSVRATDVATPLTYWTMARAWRGAYEGWMPSSDAFFGHVDKKLRGLEGFYMAGQWVEPGGGIPTAVMSGRQVIQLVCADQKRPFVATESSLVISNGKHRNR